MVNHLNLKQTIQTTLTKNINLPLTVLHTILLGARKWNGPLLGLVLVRFRKKSRYFTEQQKPVKIYS